MRRGRFWLLEVTAGGNVGAPMEMFWKLLENRRIRQSALWAGLWFAAAAVVAWSMGFSFADLKSAWRETESFLKSHPAWLFVALVILPGLPIPTSALMLLAGTIWRDHPVMACLACLTTMGINMSWTYWLAAWPGRGWVERYLARSSIRVPMMPKGNDVKVILLMRLTPGLPFFFQNYVLGFLRVPFRLYLPLSLCCSGLIACGFVLSGAGVADGNLTPVIGGAALIVLGLVVVQMLRQRLKAKS